MSNWDTYREAFKVAPKPLQNLLQSDSIALLVDELENLSNQSINRQGYLILISDFLLGLVGDTAVNIQLRKDIPEEKIDAVLLKIKSLLSEATHTPIETKEQDTQPVIGYQAAAENGEAVHQSSQDTLLRKW